MTPVPVGNVTFGNDRPFALISGPCQLETLDHARMLASRLVEMTADLGIPFMVTGDTKCRPSSNGTRDHE